MESMIIIANNSRKRMSAQTLDKLRREAMALSETDRAELAHSLVKSLDGAPDSNVADEWDREIVRRLGEIDAGTAKMIDREEFRRRMQERFGSL